MKKVLKCVGNHIEIVLCNACSQWFVMIFNLRPRQLRKLLYSINATMWGEEHANVERIKKLLLLSKYTLSWYFHTLVSFITVILHRCWAAVQSLTWAQQSIASNGNSFQNVKILIRKTWICITWMHLVPSHTGRLRRTVGSAISSKAVPMHFFH